MEYVGAARLAEKSMKKSRVMEEKRTPPELARTMMELLGCPCTHISHPCGMTIPARMPADEPGAGVGEYMASRRSRRRRECLTESGMERYPAPSPTTRWSANYPARWPGRSPIALTLEQ